MTAPQLIEAVLLTLGVVGLILTEVAGAVLRRYGFVTISEQARKTRALRWSVTLLFTLGGVWWLIHSAS